MVFYINWLPQGSILGPLLFNIFICDLFLFAENIDIASYADDNTPYTTGKTSSLVIEKLEKCSNNLFDWFYNNSMKANANKCHFLLSGNINVSLNVNNEVINSSDSEILLGVLINNNLDFDKHVGNLCLKASQKLHALTRISSYMQLNQRKLIINAFITSQFGYCPLIWMFHSRKLNIRINRIHEKALRVVYKDSSSTFEKLLLLDNSVSIHHRNLHLLAIEVYKFKNGLSPFLMDQIFENRNLNYNLRRDSNLKTDNVKSNKYGLNSITYLAPRIWDLVPTNIQVASTLNIFKNLIKTWIPVGCPCTLCKTYIKDLGYI